MKLKDYIITILLVVCIIVSSVALVKAKVIEGPVGATGSSGIKGDTGEQGPAGEAGADGINGKNGTSIHSAEIKENGHLYLTLTDGRTIDAGSVGVAGESGANGKDGKNGTNGTNGTNGKDGRGISSIYKSKTEGLIDTYTIKYTDGTTSTFTITNGKNGEDGKDAETVAQTNNKITKSVELTDLYKQVTWTAGNGGTWYGQDYDKIINYISQYVTLLNKSEIKNNSNVTGNYAEGKLIIYNSCGIKFVTIRYTDDTVEYYDTFSDNTLELRFFNTSYQFTEIHTPAHFIQSIKIDYYSYDY